MDASEFAFLVFISILGFPLFLHRAGIRPFGEREIGNLFGERFGRYPAISFLIALALCILAVVLFAYLTSLSQE
jgi:hypothetical protein